MNRHSPCLRARHIDSYSARENKVGVSVWEDEKALGMDGRDGGPAVGTCLLPPNLQGTWLRWSLCSLASLSPPSPYLPGLSASYSL